MSRAIIHRHRPLRWWSFFLLLLLVLLLLLLNLKAGISSVEKDDTDYLEHHSLLSPGESADTDTLKKLLHEQQNEILLLKQLNTTLINDLNKLEQHRQTDAAIIQEIKQHTIQLDKENYQLRRELRFYEGIMSTPAKDRDLLIQGLLIQPVKENRYQMKLVLTYMGNRDKAIKSKLAITLIGNEDEKKRTLDFHTLQVGEQISKNIELYNFTRLETEFLLPPAYEPKQIRVQLETKTSPPKKTERFFDWCNNETTEC